MPPSRYYVLMNMVKLHDIKTMALMSFYLPLIIIGCHNFHKFHRIKWNLIASRIYQIRTRIKRLELNKQIEVEMLRLFSPPLSSSSSLPIEVFVVLAVHKTNWRLFEHFCLNSISASETVLRRCVFKQLNWQIIIISIFNIIYYIGIYYKFTSILYVYEYMVCKNDFSLWLKYKIY